MDNGKRRALIKSQAAKQKESGDVVVPKGTAPSIKRKPSSKSDRPHKQQKVSLEPVVGLMAEGGKTVTLVKHGSGKGLMKAPSTSQEKPPPLLRDDYYLPWRRFHQLFPWRTTRTWAITRRRQWGRRVSLPLHK